MAADITPFIKDAQRLEKETGIPASITLGQIILESSGKFAGGLSGLAASAKNLFGVKGTGNAGSVLMPSNEFENGAMVVRQSAFKKYTSYYDSLLDHAAVLSKDRYQVHLKNAKTINDYAAGIKAGGYATDPNYVSKLLGVIQSNKLTGYDVGGKSFTPILSGNQEIGGVPSEQPSTGNTGKTEQQVKNNTIENVYFHTVRVFVLFMVFILLIVFFLKAFPAVDDVVQTVAPSPTKPLKMIKSVSKVAKAAKAAKGAKK